MSTPPRSVTLAATVGQARALQQSFGIAELPVVDRSGVLVGVVDDRSGGADLDQTVGAIMRRSPPFVDFDDDVEEALGLMAEHGVSALPVVGPRAELVGVVNRTSVGRTLTLGTQSGSGLHCLGERDLERSMV